MSVIREKLESDRIVIVPVPVLTKSVISCHHPLTLKKLSLINCPVSRGSPVTGSGISSYLTFDSLVLNLRMYGTMLRRSKTSARITGACSVLDGMTFAITATGFLNGCSDNAHESLENISR